MDRYAESGQPRFGARLVVFLSYRGVEARLADVLCECLRRDFIGLVEVFHASDTTSVPVGTRWLEEIVDGLRRSQFHIVICSNESVSRPWINYEAGAARVRDVPIAPMCHCGLVPAQLPFPLSEGQGGLLTESTDIKKLYMRIAQLLGSAVPEVDFNKYADDFRSVERELQKLERSATAMVGPDRSGAANHQAERIDDPNVLCVTSRQFEKLGYSNQLDLVLNAFPKNMRHQRITTSADLRRILLDESVDIVHVAAFVCPRGGDLYFSPVELPLGKAAPGEIDLIQAEALTALIKKAQTKLVVLGGSASVALAAELLSVTNVIAVRDLVSAAAMASWVETFYKALTTESLTSACALATRVSQAPMKFYAGQCSTQIEFRMPSASASAAQLGR